MNSHVESLLSHSAEAVLATLPRRSPSASQLAAARIVAHRGERDGRTVRENTVAAFAPAVAAGVAAIEFDVRYTRDDEPVVVHDADLVRVFGLRERVADLSWRTLRSRVPSLPHLGELIDRFAPQVHLMIELKTRGSERAEQRLARELETLTPIRDFHVLSLETTLFDAIDGLPAHCRLPVAKFNLPVLMDWALKYPCAGLAGPHLLMRGHHIERLRATRDFIGAGFVARPKLLSRELARGIEWIFTNHPLRLQQTLDRVRADGVRTGTG